MNLRSPMAKRQSLLILVVCLLFSMEAWSQQPPAQTASPTEESGAPPTPQPQSTAHEFVLKDYSKGHRAFPNVLAPYQAEEVQPPALTNTPRIDQLMRDGQIMLSMNDAVTLALENNFDIAISRFNLNIAETDILRAASGANILGINSGVVLGTPGGGVGGLSGMVGSEPVARP